MYHTRPPTHVPIRYGLSRDDMFEGLPEMVIYKEEIPTIDGKVKAAFTRLYVPPPSYPPPPPRNLAFASHVPECNSLLPLACCKRPVHARCTFGTLPSMCACRYNKSSHRAQHLAAAQDVVRPGRVWLFLPLCTFAFLARWASRCSPMS